LSEALAVAETLVRSHLGGVDPSEDHPTTEPSQQCRLCGLKGAGKPDAYGRVWCHSCSLVLGLPVSQRGYCNIGRHRKITALVGPGGEFRCGRHLSEPARGTGDVISAPPEGQEIRDKRLPDPGDRAIHPDTVVALVCEIADTVRPMRPKPRDRFHQKVALKALDEKAHDLALACRLSWFPQQRTAEAIQFRIEAAALLSPAPTCVDCASRLCRPTTSGYRCGEHADV
jgi:hypothetical protein